MNTETVLAQIVARVTEILKTVVSQTEASGPPPTLYDLEEQTQAVLPETLTGAVAGAGESGGEPG